MRRKDFLRRKMPVVDRLRWGRPPVQSRLARVRNQRQPMQETNAVYMPRGMEQTLICRVRLKEAKTVGESVRKTAGPGMLSRGVSLRRWALLGDLPPGAAAGAASAGIAVAAAVTAAGTAAV